MGCGCGGSKNSQPKLKPATVSQQLAARSLKNAEVTDMPDGRQKVVKVSILNGKTYKTVYYTNKT